MTNRPAIYAVVIDRARYDYAIVAVDNGGALHVMARERPARQTYPPQRSAKMYLATGQEVDVYDMNADETETRVVFEKLRIIGGLPPLTE